MGLFKQLVWQLGGMLDDVIRAATLPADHAHHRADVELCGVSILGGDHRHVNQQLDRYWQAAGKCLKHSHVLSLAPDVAKVGHSSFLLCPAADAETGQTCWLPPQAV